MKISFRWDWCTFVIGISYCDLDNSVWFSLGFLNIVFSKEN